MKRTAQLSAAQKSIQMDRTVDQVIALTTANNMLNAKVDALYETIAALELRVRALEPKESKTSLVPACPDPTSVN